MKKQQYIYAGICAFFIAVFFWMLSFSYEFNEVWSRIYHPDTASPSMLFTGDVMLARSVEKKMRAGGNDYPFSALGSFLKEHVAVVANFEASIPEVHVPTPDMGFSFSVDPAFLSGLKENGIGYLSLANNHSYDFGPGEYAHTKSVLKESGFIVGGDQRSVSSLEVMYTTLGDMRVAIVPVYSVFVTPDIEEIKDTLAIAATSSDIQVIYIHWGDEYELVHNTQQEVLAHAMIDAGADAIIGHHPHVVQDIQIYKGAPIFYSLGNFIFDQYWSVDVEQGLLVSLHFFGRDKVGVWNYELFPIQSSRSVPAHMTSPAREEFLTKLADRSETSLAAAIAQGTIEITHKNLAPIPN
ncbi:CapA family protein [Patescibacteria group bacterium]|nr:CapA family protein [Patescibacteria group bacterium]